MSMSGFNPYPQAQFSRPLPLSGTQSKALKPLAQPFASQATQPAPKITEITALPLQEPVSMKKSFLGFAEGVFLGLGLSNGLGCMREKGLKEFPWGKWLKTTLSEMPTFLGGGAVGYVLFAAETNEAYRRTRERYGPKATIGNLLEDPEYKGHNFRTNLVLKSAKLFHPSLKLPEN